MQTTSLEMFLVILVAAIAAGFIYALIEPSLA